MAILSPSIRRSLHRVLARTSSKPLTNANNAASLRIGTQCISRRAVHATSVVSGDALDMADTFSRRHGAFVFDGYVLCISCAHFCSHHVHLVNCNNIFTHTISSMLQFNFSTPQNNDNISIKSDLMMKIPS